jgi:hypothetical protein
MIRALLMAVALPSALFGDDPPIHVRLDAERYYRGDRGRVWVETVRDGYVLALHAGPTGRVRVLFPLDPGDDAFVRGGEALELLGRGDREAFFVDAREGSGMVLATYSPDPFRFDEFVRGDHWDYRVLGGPDVREDPEAALLEIVGRMASGGRFEYDVGRYVVEEPVSVRLYDHGYYPRFRASFGYGYPSFICTSLFCDRFSFSGLFYDPFFFDPFFDPFFFAPACFDPVFGFRSFCFRSGFAFRTVFVSRPFVFVRGGTIVRTPRFVIPRDRVRVAPSEPRRRSVAADWSDERRIVRSTASRGRNDLRRSPGVRRSPESRDAPGLVGRSGIDRGRRPETRAPERWGVSRRPPRGPSREFTRPSWRGNGPARPTTRGGVAPGRGRFDGRAARPAPRGASGRRRP